MDKIKFYCVTNKKIQFIEDKNYNFGWVGQDKPPETYLSCNTLDNIYYKEKYYSELTFHYWFWKNILKYEDDDTWIGFCQKRRYWIREHINNLIDKSNINHYLLKEIDNDSHFDAIICNPVSTSGIKKTKLIKKGWKNLVKNPIIFFNDKYQNIELHFDMHHGYGNLNAAIQLISSNDRDEFSNYVKKKTKFNPNIMFISKKKIADKWFRTLFEWLEKCEKKFGFKNLHGYETTRIYAYLAERYLSFWFKKYTRYKEHPWTFIDV